MYDVVNVRVQIIIVVERTVSCVQNRCLSASIVVHIAIAHRAHPFIVAHSGRTISSVAYHRDGRPKHTFVCRSSSKMMLPASTGGAMMIGGRVSETNHAPTR